MERFNFMNLLQKRLIQINELNKSLISILILSKNIKSKDTQKKIHEIIRQSIGDDEFNKWVK